jgi:NAD(P)H-hydrate epimerase
MMFVGPDGDVVPSLTESEMREVDRVAIEETGPNLFQMMENAVIREVSRRSTTIS